MAYGELNEYTLQRGKDGAEAVKRMLKSPLSFAEALAQTERLQAEQRAFEEGWKESNRVETGPEKPNPGEK